MKTCPYCAEEIQDAAIVCKHCGRDLTPQRPQPTPPAAPPVPAKKTPSTLKWILVGLVALVIVGFCARVMVSPTESTTTPGTERPLNITAAKGPLGFSITNREDTALRACQFSVTDAERVEWSVEGDRILSSGGVIDPLETATIEWNRFTAKGQPMPSHIGRDRGVHVSCLVTGLEQRLTAAFR